MSENFKRTLLSQLGLQLKQLRIEKGLAQADVALQADLSLETIRLLEEGKNLSYHKYKCLINFYRKKIVFTLLDK